MEKRNLRKERVGVVTSNKMEKSIVVSEVKKVKHPMYGKFVLKTKSYVVHDQESSQACSIEILLSRSASQTVSPDFPSIIAPSGHISG